MRSKNYQTLNGLQVERESVPWYWRLIALTASWMILGGYLIIPALYDRDPKLKFSNGVLTVFVVALMTAGYSFTALLCFACRNEMFQVESIFLPALTSSALGLLTVCYNFASSNRYYWGTASIVTTVLSVSTCLIYGILLIWTHHRIVRLKAQAHSRTNNMWSESTYYTNYLANMYPTHSKHMSADSQLHTLPLSEDDRINQQMAMLLMRSDSGPSPDASQSTFRIDLPEDREERERMANSSELLGTPGVAHADWGRTRAGSGSNSPFLERSAWERGRSNTQSTGGHSRAKSREERRREIELGAVPSPRSGLGGV